MNIAWWKLAAFTLAVIALGWGIFPSTRDMASLYVQSGQLQKAQRALTAVLNAGKPDFATTMLAADLALRKGEVYDAVRYLEQAHTLRPHNIPMLEKLVQLREWTRNPQGAAAIREEILRIQPERADLLQKLAEAYGYFAQYDMESLAIARLVLLGDPPPPPDEKPAQPGSLQADLRQTVRQLARQRMSNGPDPFLNAALSHLHRQAEQRPDPILPRPEAALLQEAAVTLLTLGFYDEAATLALTRDAHTGGTTTNRRLMAEAMGWSGLTDSMPDVFTLMAEQDAGNITLLQALLDTAQAYGAQQAVQTVALQLEQQAPQRRDVQILLAGIDLHNGNLTRALAMLQQEHIPADIRRVEAARFMESAAASPSRQLRIHLLDATRQLPHDGDVAYLRARAILLASVDRQTEALPLYALLVDQPDPTPDDVAGLLVAAAASKDARTTARAEDLARTRFAHELPVTRALATLYVTTGRPQLGLPLLRQLVAQSGTEDDAEAMLGAIAQVADAQLAMTFAPALAARYPSSSRVVMAAATALSSSGQYDAAYPLAAKAVRLGQATPEQLDLLLQIAAATAKSPIFTQALQLVAQHDPASAPAAALVIRALAPTPTAEATHALQRGAAGQARLRIQSWAAIADTGGITEDAFRLYAALYRSRPSDTVARDAFVRLAGWTGRPAEAAPVLATIADAQPGNHAAVLAAATAWLEAGSPPKALPYARQALSLRPDHTETLRQAALALSGTANYAEALPPMERLLARNALSTDEKVLLAETYVSAGRPSEALPLLTPLLGHATLPQGPGLALARALAATDRKPEAAQVRRRLAAEDTSNRKLQRTLGAEAYFAGDNAEAAAVFDRLAATAPDDTTALKGAAISASALQDHQKAVRLFEKYLRLVPDDADARYRLAEELNLQGKGELAARHYKAAARGLKAMPPKADATTQPPAPASSKPPLARPLPRAGRLATTGGQP